MKKKVIIIITFLIVMIVGSVLNCFAYTVSDSPLVKEGTETYEFTEGGTKTFKGTLTTSWKILDYQLDMSNFDTSIAQYEIVTDFANSHTLNFEVIVSTPTWEEIYDKSAEQPNKGTTFFTVTYLVETTNGTLINNYYNKIKCVYTYEVTVGDKYETSITNEIENYEAIPIAKERATNALVEANTITSDKYPIKYVKIVESKEESLNEILQKDDVTAKQINDAVDALLEAIQNAKDAAEEEMRLAEEERLAAEQAEAEKAAEEARLADLEEKVTKLEIESQLKKDIVKGTYKTKKIVIKTYAGAKVKVKVGKKTYTKTADNNGKVVIKKKFKKGAKAKVVITYNDVSVTKTKKITK